MDESPYQSPAPIPPEYPAAQGPEREKLYRVAKYQRWVIYALLANIAVNILGFALMGQGLAVAMAVVALSLAVVAFAIISVFLLAKEVINVGVAVLCALMMIVPCVSLLVLLIVNQKATSYLQQHGIKVGFFGVDPGRMERP